MIKMVDKSLTCLIIFLITGIKSERSNSWVEIYFDIDTVGRYYLFPCTDFGEDTSSNLFEASELPLRTQNPYLVLIHYEFSVEKVDVTLGSPATVYFYQGVPFTALASNFTLTNSFTVKINVLSFIIERIKPSTVPHVVELEINGIRLCKDPDRVNLTARPQGPGQEGTHDRFIERYKQFESVTLPVTDSFCGRRKVEQTQLIVNGAPTKPGDWPWHTSIYKYIKATTSYICGGTLISKFHILTAAHCVTSDGSPLLPALLSVVLGKYYLRGFDKTAVVKEVHEVIVHESFNPKDLSSDIALLKMASKAEYDDYIQPVCLWQGGLNSKLPEEVFGTVVGWGIDHTDELSSELQQARIPMIEEIKCLKSNRGFFGRRLDDNNFCAGYRNGTSACNGDSGGGFTISVEGRYYIRGIVSSAVARQNEPKCDPTQYVLFTDVEKYLKWIRVNTN